MHSIARKTTAAMLSLGAVVAASALVYACPESCPHEIFAEGYCNVDSWDCPSNCEGNFQDPFSDFFYCAASDLCKDCIGGGAPAWCYMKGGCEEQAGVSECGSVNAQIIKRNTKQQVSC